MESTEKPTLPSFHTLFSGIEDTSKMISHRRHKSDHLSAFKPFKKEEPSTSISPVFEKLSIQSIPVRQSINEDSVYYPIPTYQHHHHQKVSRSLHSRSYSDYSHPYPSNGPPHTTGAQLKTIHRRTVSATSLDFILQSNNPSSLVASPSSSSLTTTTSISHASPEEESTIRSESPALHLGLKSENKYHCSYCNKTFSRPSSLRIHIYSHTGERPFECPHPKCSRKFSVQSNLRRHMRTHRTGKTHRFANGPGGNMDMAGTTGTSGTGAAGQVNRAQLSQKPLAAKPTCWSN